MQSSTNCCNISTNIDGVGNNNGVTNINTAADAAKALEPLVQTFPNAGVIAKVIFAIGVIGMGLLGIPVLAGSASYAVSETFGFNAGLDKKAWEAKGFYGIIVISTLIGFSMTLIGIDPIKALIFAAVLMFVTPLLCRTVAVVTKINQLTTIENNIPITVSIINSFKVRRAVCFLVAYSNSSTSSAACQKSCLFHGDTYCYCQHHQYWC